MTNSIREALTDKSEKEKKYGAIIASVLLALKSNVYENKAVAIVEGPDDVDLYGRLYSASRIIFLPVRSCRHIIEVLKALDPKGYSDRLLAIKDADFDHLNSTVYEYSNLFLTDFHDAEILEIESSESMNAAWEKHTVKTEQIPSGLKEEIYSELTELSMLKWYNYTFKTTISFKETKIGSSIDSSGHFDYIYYTGILFSRDKNIGKEPDGEQFKNWKSANTSKYISTEITNGHDFIDLMLHKVKYFSHGTISKKSFAKTLRDNYSLSAYRKTKMSQQIGKWLTERHYQ